MLDYSNYQRFSQFKNRPILAVDFGYKVVGTAVFCPGRDPYPLMGLKIIYQSDVDTISQLKKFIEEEAIEIIVLGIPYYLDGKESELTKSIKRFGELLKTAFVRCEFYEQDETLSTKEAQERMKSSPQFNFKVDPTQIDCLAATIILEDFIRS